MKTIKRWLLLVAAVVGVALAGCAPAPGGTTPSGGGESSWTLIIFLVLIFAIFYFLMIRPQRKRQQQHQRLLQDISKGDRIMTIGGMFGEIESIDEDSFVIKVESGATIRMSRNSIASKIER